MKILCATPLKHLPGVFEELLTYGAVAYEPNITGDELKAYLKTHRDIDALLVTPHNQNYKLGQDILAGSSVKLINSNSTGTNHIDVAWCQANGIQVWSTTKDFEMLNSLSSTAELAFGLMLGLFRYIPQSFESVKKGQWDYQPYIGRMAQGLTIGVVGLGRLGSYMAKYAESFGMKVLVVDPHVPVKTYEKVKLEELAERADVISLHVHVTPETTHMIDGQFINSTKRKPYIINTARGEIVDESSIIDGLKSGKLAGYGTDGLEDEFGGRTKSPIIKAAQEGLNVIVVPHTGGATWEGMQKAFLWTIRKFKTFKA